MAEAASQVAEATPKDERTVIIAMDGSEHADYALDWYTNYVRKPHDHLIVVFVMEWEHYLHVPRTQAAMIGKEVLSSKINQANAKIQEELDKLGDKLRERHIGGKVKEVEAKKPGDGILKAAKEHDADLIIVGNRGLGTVRRTILGSVSDYILHHSHIPVAICKHPDYLHHHHH